ncbi:large conductance mechanosensitive channel [Nitrobacteraceae bacterium AZCC 2146]
MLKEFREFAMKGNVVDLAVGVIIGAAFGAIVTSLVGDIIMPVIGAITGGLDFSNYFTGLSKAVTATNLADAKKQGAVLAWGSFLTLSINFIIIAFVLFLAIRFMNKLKRNDAAAPPKRDPPRRIADRDPRSAQEGVSATLEARVIRFMYPEITPKACDDGREERAPDQGDR